MAEHVVDIQIEEGLGMSFDEHWFHTVAVNVLDIEELPTPAELGLLITTAEKIQRLNKAYRDKDEPTDVLSFTMRPDPGTVDMTEFVTPPEEIEYLGEVIVSYPTAMAQALELDHNIEYELALLVTHGILHLLGYTHDLPEDLQYMQSREIEALKKLNIEEM
jgi:probable rRNA maturation factor